MRLSELLKNNPEVASGAAAPPAPQKPKVSQPARPATPRAAAPARPVTPPAPPAPSIENIETKIRSGIEKEFSDRMRRMEEEIKRVTEERMAAQQRLMESQQQAMEAEKNLLAEELKNLKVANENLALEKKIQEQESQKRLAEEKLRLEKEYRDQALQSAQKKVEDFEAQRRKEQELAEKQRQAAELLKKTPEVKPPAPSADSLKIKPAAPEIKPAAAQANPPAVPGPPPPVSKTSAAFPSKAENANEEVFVLDAKTEEKLRKLYQTLAQTGDHIFEKLLRDGKLEADFLKKLLSEVYELIERHDQDFLMIVLEPYASSDYFVFHAANCAVLSTIIGQELKLPPEDVKELALAAFVHDIGLLGIRENLDYPKPLTSELKSEILRHPERGSALLKDSCSKNILDAVHQHHETINGKGYPDALAGEEIHVYARIIQVVDAFEAMTHYRPYRPKPMEVSEALREMVDRGRGVYDREAVKALMTRIGLYPVLSLVELSNHKVARVVRQSRKFPLSPVVRIEFDEEGNKLKAPFLIDLSKNQLIHIHGPVGSSESYGKDQINKKEKEETVKPGAGILQLLPFVLILVFLAVMAYIILKL